MFRVIEVAWGGVDDKATNTRVVKGGFAKKPAAQEYADSLNRKQDLKAEGRMLSYLVEPERARLDPDGTAKGKTRIVNHPKAGWCVGPGIALRNPEYEDQNGNRTPL